MADSDQLNSVLPADGNKDLCNSLISSHKSIVSEKIYKRDSLGNIRFWQFEVEDDRWRTISGLMGTQSPSFTGWTNCTPKSRETAQEQAVFEASAEMKKKLERDYHLDISTIDNPLFFKPMLAKEYEGFVQINGRVIFSQPKLDGIRCIATAKGLFSRQGKRFLSCPHVESALQTLFDKHPDLVLDGELYNHDLKDDFNTITSVVRKQKPSKRDIGIAMKSIQYHVYDLASTNNHATDTFGTRYASLTDLLTENVKSDMIRIVPTDIISTEESLNKFFEKYVKDGYEGQMIRFDGPYEQKRSKLLLKRKEFKDDEFRLIRVEEGIGNWAGYGKKAVFALPDGREFGAGVKGNQQFTKELLAHWQKYTTGKVRFFDYTPDGIPRFPVAVDFFEGERTD